MKSIIILLGMFLAISLYAQPPAKMKKLLYSEAASLEVRNIVDSETPSLSRDVLKDSSYGSWYKCYVFTYSKIVIRVTVTTTNYPFEDGVYVSVEDNTNNRIQLKPDHNYEILQKLTPLMN